MDDNKGMTLKDIYVEPTFKIHTSCIDNINELSNSKDSFYKIENDSSIHAFFNDFFFTSKKNHWIKSSNVCLLLGYPGQGKTSFCIKLLNDYLINESNKEKYIFYFKLKNIRDSKNLVNNPLSILYDEAVFLTEIEIDKHLFRKSVLILDGLDELFMKEGLKSDDIERFCKELIRESEKFNHLQVVITSRYGYVELEKLKKESILIFQLESFDQNKQQEWIEKFYRFHPDTWLTPKQLDFYNSKKGYAQKRYIKEFLEQPLLLHILASLTSNINDKIDRTTIYNQLFVELIERRYSSDGQLEILKNIEKNDLREVIQEIAFAIYKSGNGFIGKKEILKLQSVQKYLGKLSSSEFIESIKGIMISFYFKETEQNIYDEKDYVIEFLHKSLQEFMVAEKIVRTISFDFRNKDLKGRYIIDNYSESLKLLNELFACQPLSREIQRYLIEMIDKLEGKEEITIRILLFFNEMTTKDFLHHFDCNSENNPIERSLYCFNGTWLFLKELSKDRNYLEEVNTREKVADYLKTLSNSYPTIDYGEISYQNLSSIDLSSFRSIGKDEITNANFEQSDLSNSQLIAATIVNCNFANADLHDLGIYDCFIQDCTFLGSDLTEANLINIVFENVDFSNTIIDNLRISNISFKKMKYEYFYNVHFMIDDLISFIKSGAKIKINKLNKVTRDGYLDIINYDELITLIKFHIPDYKEI